MVQLVETQALVAKVELRVVREQPIEAARLDPNGIFRCLVNLVRNAVEACEGGGEVVVRTGQQRDGALVIRVSDDGCGMDAEMLDGLFVKIFSTKGSRGTGFGLPTTHKIVAEHGGAISAESEVGAGSTFTMKLPRQST